jgi:putative addiction module CopG family antidote
MSQSITLELTREQEEFIKQSLASGRYRSEAEVVGEALALLQKHERENEDMRSIFAEAHRRNADLSSEEAEALVQEAIAETRKNNRSL